MKKTCNIHLQCKGISQVKNTLNSHNDTIKQIKLAYHISSNKCQGEEGGSYLVSKAIGQKKKLKEQIMHLKELCKHMEIGGRTKWKINYPPVLNLLQLMFEKI